MKGYSELGTRGQVDRLRPLAKLASAKFGYPEGKLRLVNHGFNTTWELRTQGGTRFALRMNVSSHRRPAQIRAETEWVSALSRDTDLLLPIPQRASSGEFVVWVDWPQEDRQVACVLFSWLQGTHVDKKLDAPLMEEIGRVTTQLHEHAAMWNLRDGCELDVMDNALWNEPWRIRDEFLDVFQLVCHEADTLLSKFKQDIPTRILHFDLHMHNLMKCGNRVAVFDFDDTVLGWPIQDVAISLFYFRRFTNPEFSSAFWRGLDRTCASYGVSEADLELLIASRAVFMANAMHGIKTASIAEIAPRYEEVTYKRLLNFLETRVFDPNSVPWS